MSPLAKLKAEDPSAPHPKTILVSVDEDGSVVTMRPLNPWQALPARYRLVVAMSLCFVICNMDKVNISVAILPMSQEFGWSPTVAGFVQVR